MRTFIVSCNNCVWLLFCLNLPSSYPSISLAQSTLSTSCIMFTHSVIIMPEIMNHQIFLATTSTTNISTIFFLTVIYYKLQSCTWYQPPYSDKVHKRFFYWTIFAGKKKLRTVPHWWLGRTSPKQGEATLFLWQTTPHTT